MTPPAPGVARRARGRRVLAAGLMVVGSGLLIAWAVESVQVSRAAVGATRRVDRLLTSAVSPPPEPPVTTPTVLPTRTAAPLPTVTPVPAIGQALGRLSIARVGLAVPVLQGVGDAVLDAGAGHFPETAALGGDGNCAVAAHRDTHFRALEKVRPGDEVLVELPRRTVRYRITRTAVVEPDAVDVLDDVGDDRLTLVTCYPFSWVGPAPRRFVVVARREATEDDQVPATSSAGDAKIVAGDHDDGRRDRARAGRAAATERP